MSPRNNLTEDVLKEHKLYVWVFGITGIVMMGLAILSFSCELTKEFFGVDVLGFILTLGSGVALLGCGIMYNEYDNLKEAYKNYRNRKY